MKRTLTMVAVAAMFLFRPAFACASNEGGVGDINIENGNKVTTTVNTTVDTRANATGGNAKATGGDAKSTAIINTPVNPGFVQLPSVAGVRSENLTAAETDIFAAGISRQSISFYEENGGRLKSIELARLAKAGKSDFVTFDFSSRKVIAGSVALATGSFEIDSRKAIDLMMSIAKEAMDMGGDLVQISAVRRIDIKSHSRGIGTGWNPLCLVGLSGGLSGGSSHEEDGQVVIRVTIWKTSQQIVPSPKPEPECDVNAIWLHIRSLEKEVQQCTTYCYNNLTLRNALHVAYIDLYACTGEKQYLNDAIYHAEVAERNFLKGTDISVHQREANQIMSQVYYDQAGCIYLTRGKVAASRFADAKNLERYPTNFGK